MVEDIYRRRQPLPSMDAIYFIQPSKEKYYISRLMDVFFSWHAQHLFRYLVIITFLQSLCLILLWMWGRVFLNLSYLLSLILQCYNVSVRYVWKITFIQEVCQHLFVSFCLLLFFGSAAFFLLVTDFLSPFCVKGVCFLQLSNIKRISRSSQAGFNCPTTHRCTERGHILSVKRLSAMETLIVWKMKTSFNC